MASALINNASQIYFDSVFGMENEGMVKMFKALESSELKGFLGCSSAIYEDALVEFFQNTYVQNDKLREMKFEFRLLNEIMAKTVTVKAELMSLEDLLKQIPDDMMMPSITATDPTKIKFVQGIEIRKVDLYKADLPQIAADDKGKEPLVVDTIQWHPARQIFSLICADIDFLVQFREQVIEEVVKFFNSFTLHRLTVLDSVKDIVAKEELVLTWAETDSVHIALQRRVYIIAKYREMLLRKFLEARRHNFVSGRPKTAIDLKVLDLLTAGHHFALKILMRQMKEHKLEWTRTYSSHLFDVHPVSQGNRHFTVGGGRLRQSGPQPEGRLLRQPALEGLTRSARTDSPYQVGRNKFRRSKAAAAVEERRGDGY
ncbi:hypothetical protein F511_03560 [Dorcoceras hygrometricum]|uniref:Uncharacterized protein n=1 Tax=Dorcoceras hygrometricum TaxID=472368 RepID=A0A2Z7AVZ6_9LAMI|nr:hypothetical protein F511_03560 [Dorcoceras hygrometricum]